MSRQLSIRSMGLAGALAAMLAVPMARADSFYHEIEHSYAFDGVPGGAALGPHPLSVTTRSVRSSGPIRESYAQTLTQSRPGDTTNSIAMSAFADFSTRRFGTAVTGSAQINPFDPDNPQILPSWYSVRGRIDAIVSDDVRIYSPSVPEGYKVRFSIAPGRLDGRLSVPDASSGAAGVASVQLSFSLFGFQPEGIRSSLSDSGSRRNGRGFEQILMTSDSGPSDVRLGAPLAPDTNFEGVTSSTFTVFNGETYTFDLRLASTIAAAAFSFPAESPPRAVSRSQFDSTYYYNGLTDFRDGDGNPLSDLSFTSAAGSGFDWVSQEASAPIAVVPVPASAALLAGGLALLMGASVRRRAVGKAAATAARCPRQP